MFNEGSANIDFRVESDSNTHALFVDAGNDAVGIGGSPLTTSQLTVSASSNTNIVLDGESYTTWVQDAEWNSLLIGGAYYDSGAKYGVTNRGASQINIGHDGNATPTLQGFIFSAAAAGTAGTAPSFENLASITRAGTVFNEDSNDYDFRVESDNNSNMFRVDAGNDQIRIGDSAGKASAPLTVTGQLSNSVASGASVDIPLSVRAAYFFFARNDVSSASCISGVITTRFGTTAPDVHTFFDAGSGFISVSASSSVSNSPVLTLTNDYSETRTLYVSLFALGHST